MQFKNQGTKRGASITSKEQTVILVDFINRHDEIRELMEQFDRELADEIRPLALFYDGFDVDGKGAFEQKKPGDGLSNNFVFQQVIDKICKLNWNDPNWANKTGNSSNNAETYKNKIEDIMKLLHEVLNSV